jgi:transposase
MRPDDTDAEMLYQKRFDRLREIGLPTLSPQDDFTRPEDFMLPDDSILSDELWQEISLLLPPAKPKKKAGRPRMDDRQVMTAILYRLKTGCRWKKLPRKFGASSTIHDRWLEWKQAGVFNLLREQGIEGYTLKQDTFVRQNEEERYLIRLEHSNNEARNYEAKLGQQRTDTSPYDA